MKKSDIKCALMVMGRGNKSGKIMMLKCSAMQEFMGFQINGEVAEMWGFLQVHQKEEL